MAVSDSSIISNDEIELKIVPTIIDGDAPFSPSIVAYSLELKNKTDKIIYVDRANSFRIYTDGTSDSYYTNEQTTVSHGSSRGIGVNLGGIAGPIGLGGLVGTLASAFTVGGSSQNSSSTTYSQERIVAIPPHSVKDLIEFKQVEIQSKSAFRGAKYKTISDLDQYQFCMNGLYGVLKDGGHISYSEEESPYNSKHLITYSNSSDFSTYSQLYAKVYARYIVGCDFLELGILLGVRKYVSNFFEDDGVMAGRLSTIEKNNTSKPLPW